MTDALLAEILANPRNKAARLVYADHLLERGDERGELIQLECAGKRLAPDGIARRDELRKRLHAEWKTRGLEITLDGGFVRCVRGPAAAIVTQHAHLAREPVEDLRISPASDMRPFAALDVLARVKSLAIHNGLQAAAAGHLAVSTKLAQLHKLQLAIGEGHAPIKQAAWADQLGSLVVYAVGARRPFDLADYAFPNVTALELEGCRIGEHAGALAQQLPRLQSIKLAYNDLGGEGACALAAVPLARLSNLTIFYDPPTDAGVRALAASSAWPVLRRLALPHGKLEDAAIEALVGGSRCATLVELDLSYNPFGDRGARAIAESPLLRGVRFLSLAYTAVTLDGLRALADGLPALERLSIGRLFGDEAKAIFAHRAIKLLS